MDRIERRRIEKEIYDNLFREFQLKIEKLQCQNNELIKRLGYFFQCIDNIDKSLGLDLTDAYKVKAYNYLREMIHKDE